MPRDAHIPLFLWVATALLIHLLGGNGAHRAADWMEERIELKRFVEGVRSYVRSSTDTLEVSLVEDQVTPPEPERDPQTPQDAEADPKDETTEPEEKPKTAPPKAPDPKKPEPEKDTPKPEERKPEPEPEPKPVIVEKKQPVEAQPLVERKQVAVRQHVEDKDQKDNPNADFISEHNNRVKEQTQSRLTSNDENDPKPTPGSNASGVGPEPGDSRENRIAQSEDRPGEEARAPADDPASRKAQPSSESPNAGDVTARAQAHAAPARNGSQAGENKTEPQQAVAQNSTPGSKGQAEQRAQEASPDWVGSERGGWDVPNARAELKEQEARKSQRKRELPRRKVRGYGDLLGLGAAGTTANGINLNLTPGLAVNAIGVDQLSRERRADAARRRSQHLGSWKSTGIERWRSAIENYVASVKPGNQTALNTARSPFASYLASIHNRLHPIFADWFLASLDSLPQSHPMNNPTISTSLEIILDQDEGRIVNMGVTKTSGITAFDIAALDSVQRASPFGAPPREILSPDGNVYLHW
ncbi:MAG TPA: hypothetical protein VFQ61_13280, partial [Polyangiaceae bacterium]|nr:hypothetical protein [Polyangiaceae bacterium]